MPLMSFLLHYVRRIDRDHHALENNEQQQQDRDCHDTQKGTSTISPLLNTTVTRHQQQQQSVRSDIDVDFDFDSIRNATRSRAIEKSF